MPRVVADIRIVLSSTCWIGQRPQPQIPAPAVSERSAHALNRTPRRLSLEGVIVVGTPVGVIGDAAELGIRDNVVVGEAIQPQRRSHGSVIRVGIRQRTVHCANVSIRERSPVVVEVRDHPRQCSEISIDQVGQGVSTKSVGTNLGCCLLSCAVDRAPGTSSAVPGRRTRRARAQVHTGEDLVEQTGIRIIARSNGVKRCEQAVGCGSC